jgi:hypothetical protein
MAMDRTAVPAAAAATVVLGLTADSAAAAAAAAKVRTGQAAWPARTKAQAVAVAMVAVVVSGVGVVLVALVVRARVAGRVARAALAGARGPLEMVGRVLRERPPTRTVALVAMAAIPGFPASVGRAVRRVARARALGRWARPGRR